MGHYVNDCFVRGKSLNRKSSRLNRPTCWHRSNTQISLEATLGRLAAARSEGCQRNGSFCKISQKGSDVLTTKQRNSKSITINEQCDIKK